MPGNYVQVEILAAPPLIDNLVGILTQLGFEGFWEDGQALRCYIGEERWSPAFETEIRSVIGIVARSSSTTAPSITVTQLAATNWNQEWERTIRPIQVTDRIIITPTWQEVRPHPGQIVLRIDPKMSFGTGYHETTRLVLKLMDRLVRPGISLLDLGTGTGVLAIAGIKLGARSAVALDVDEWSTENTRENLLLNDVEQAVRVIRGDLSAAPATPFEMIVANIQRSVIEPIIPQLERRLTPDGLMILSGLLREDEELLAGPLSRARLRIDHRLTEHEWVALVVAHQGA